MFEHILWSPDEVTQPFGTIWVEEGFDKFLGQPVHLLRPVDPSPQDLLVDPGGGLVKEGREADHHFICEYTARPPVGRFAVTLI